MFQSQINEVVSAIVAGGGKLAGNGRAIQPAKWTSRLAGLSLGRFDALTEEQLTSVIEVIGQEMADMAGLATAEQILARANPDAGKAQAAMAARTGQFAPKGQEYGAGIRHGLAD